MYVFKEFMGSFSCAHLTVYSPLCGRPHNIKFITFVNSYYGTITLPLIDTFLRTINHLGSGASCQLVATSGRTHDVQPGHTHGRMSTAMTLLPDFLALHRVFFLQ